MVSSNFNSLIELRSGSQCPGSALHNHSLPALGEARAGAVECLVGGEVLCAHTGRSCGQPLLTAVKTMNDLRYPNADLVSCSRQSSRAVCITSNDSAMPCFTLWWVLPPFKLRSSTGELCGQSHCSFASIMPHVPDIMLPEKKISCHIYLSEHQSFMCESAARAHRLCMKPHFCRVFVPTISLLIRRY